MYLDYETYESIGNGSVSAEDFPSVEAWAEAMLDTWTLNRLKVIDWSEWETQVEQVMARLVDNSDAIQAAEKGQALSSFSNGQDSYSFSTPDENSELAAVAGYAAIVLPVELLSACTSYNGAS